MKHVLALLCAALAAASTIALANDSLADNACETPLLKTSADVETSYGAAYRVETYFRTPQETAARFVTDKPSLMAVEGPLVWVKSAESESLAGENERRFVIGHQFHALAFNFDDIMSDVKAVKKIAFKDGSYKGRTGHYPDGGDATLVVDKDKRPLGLLLELPDDARIEVAYDDWRETPSGEPAPYTVTVLHKDNSFTYRYTDVSFGTGDAVSYQEAYPAPAIEALRNYRKARADEASKCASAANH